MKPPSLEHPKRCDAKYFSFHSNPSTPSTYKQVPNFQSKSWRLGGGKRRRISQPLQAARLSLQLATEPAFHNYVNRSHHAVTAEQHFPPSERLKGQRSAGFEAQRSACDCRPTAGSGGPRRPAAPADTAFRFGFFRSSRRNAAALPAAQRGFPVQPLPSPGRSRPRAARTLWARLWAHPEAAQRRAGRPAPARNRGPGVPAFRSHLLADPRLQLAPQLGPGQAVQVVELAQDEQRAALRVRLAGVRLELQLHVRHLPARGPARPHGSAPPPSAGCEGRGGTAAPRRSHRARQAGGAAGPGCARRLTAWGSAEQRWAGTGRNVAGTGGLWGALLGAAVPLPLTVPRSSQTTGLHWKPLFPFNRSAQGWKWCKIVEGSQWKS